jgi:hypothetical protein
MALRDRGPESDFRGYFSDTETKLDEGNTEISRHFERGPLWYALETDWLAEEPVEIGPVSAWEDSRCGAKTGKSTDLILYLALLDTESNRQLNGLMGHSR